MRSSGCWEVSGVLFIDIVVLENFGCGVWMQDLRSIQSDRMNRFLVDQDVREVCEGGCDRIVDRTVKDLGLIVG